MIAIIRNSALLSRSYKSSYLEALGDHDQDGDYDASVSVWGLTEFRD
jgi:hypothetical protein